MGLKIGAGLTLDNGLRPQAIAGVAPTLDYRFARDKRETEAVSLTDKLTFTGGNQGTFVGSDGYIQRATTNVPRFDHDPVTRISKGLLVEGSRTNSIRNNTMVGAVAGTPGTLPTNWAATTPANGITREIVGTGTEDGIAYVDIKFSGTNTLGSSFYMDITFDNGTITAAQSQAWTESCYVRLLSGVISGADFSTGPHLVLYGTPGFNDNVSVSLSTASSAPLIRQRFSCTKTFANVATTGASPRLTWTIATGGTIDFTLRIGLPQLEQGAFATSVIPTTSSTVTRATDVASISGSNFSSWYRQEEGTVFVNAASTRGSLVGFSDGTSTERYRLVAASTALAGFGTSGGSTQFNFTTGSDSWISPNSGKGALGLKLNNFSVVANGNYTATDSSGTLPNVDRVFIGNAQISDPLNGHLRRLTYWPTRLGNEVLQTITQ